MASKEDIISSARIVKGIINGTMYQDEFYKDDDKTPKTPSDKAMQQQIDMIKYNMEFIKHNEKYIIGVELNEDENSLIQYTKEESVNTFLENGAKNWENHGGGSSSGKYFSNPFISLENDVMIFNVEYDKLSLDFPDYLEVNNITENILYSNGNPRDGKPLKTPVNVGLYASKFKGGTVLVFTIYSDRGQSASISYTI